VAYIIAYVKRGNVFYDFILRYRIFTFNDFLKMKDFLDIIFLLPVFRKQREINSYEDIDLNTADMLKIVIGMMIWFCIIGIFITLIFDLK
jgi:hypothetical protein